MGNYYNVVYQDDRTPGHPLPGAHSLLPTHSSNEQSVTHRRQRINSKTVGRYGV